MFFVVCCLCSFANPVTKVEFYCFLFMLFYSVFLSDICRFCFILLYSSFWPLIFDFSCVEVLLVDFVFMRAVEPAASAMGFEWLFLWFDVCLPLFEGGFALSLMGWLGFGERI